jgi:transposase
MGGVDHQQSGMFSYISAERRVPKDHPLRAIWVMVDAALKASSWRFEAVYASRGRPSIAPEKLLRALLLPVLYPVRSERLLLEQRDYNCLFRGFVGLNLDAPGWDVTVFTKNRERLLVGAGARAFSTQWSSKRRPKGGSPTSILRSLAHGSRPGPDPRVSSARETTSKPGPPLPATRA